MNLANFFPTHLLAADSTTKIDLSPLSLLPLVIGVGLALFLWAIGKVPLRYNLRNLSVRWRTTLMTAAAFTMVVALMTVMLAFVNGMYKLTEGSGQPGNVLILSEGTTDETFSNLGFSDIGDIELQPGIARDASGRPLSSRETYIVVNQPVENPIPGRPPRRFLQVRGLDDSAMAGAVHGLTLYEGSSWVSREGVQSVGAGEADAIQAVIGEGVARELGRDRHEDELAKARNRDRLDVGDVFSLARRKFAVVGVMKSSGATFDSEIWAKRDIVGPMFGKGSYSSLVLRTANAKAAREVKRYFNDDYQKAAVQAYLETEYFATLAETNKQFLYSIIFVTVIMSIGGIFGVMNTMFAAVSQRTKDIGVLRLLGFSRWQVQSSFLLESLALSLAGGSLGCALGTLAHGWKASSVVSNNQGSSKFVVLELAVSGDIIAVGLVLTLAMGLIGGIIPSLYAMFTRPLESLR